MAGKRIKIFIIVLLAIMSVGIGIFSYQKITERKRSLICAKAYINLILEMYEAEKLFYTYVENEKTRAENKHLIKRHLEEIRKPLKKLISHSGESKERVQRIKKAIEDWDHFSNAFMSALTEISEKGSAEDTGEISAFSKLATENFLESMFIAFSTFSNLDSEPPVKEKEKIKLNLSQEERKYLSGRLKDAYKSICIKQKEEKRLSGIEWSLVGTKNFIDNPNNEIEQIINCKSID